MFKLNEIWKPRLLIRSINIFSFNNLPLAVHVDFKRFFEICQLILFSLTLKNSFSETVHNDLSHSLRHETSNHSNLNSIIHSKLNFKQYYFFICYLRQILLYSDQNINNSTRKFLIQLKDAHIIIFVYD